MRLARHLPSCSSPIWRGKIECGLQNVYLQLIVLNFFLIQVNSRHLRGYFFCTESTKYLPGEHVLESLAL